jgi:hypothetical protein
MSVSIRKFLLDRDDTLYRLPTATFDRMLRFPETHRITRFASQRVRSAEVVVELMNGRPSAVLRSVFSMMMFKRDGTLLSPLRDPHVLARAELALALDSPDPRASVADAASRFVARGDAWKPPAALLRRIEQSALGRLKCSRISPTLPGTE